LLERRSILSTGTEAVAMSSNPMSHGLTASINATVASIKRFTSVMNQEKPLEAG
jgi:hypothetical protein